MAAKNSAWPARQPSALAAQQKLNPMLHGLRIVTVQVGMIASKKARIAKAVIPVSALRRPLSDRVHVYVLLAAAPRIGVPIRPSSD